MKYARILQFTNDGAVYISTETRAELTRIENAAVSYIASLATKPQSEPPQLNELCLVQLNGSWHRGRVERAFVSVTHGTLALVFLIDHGRSINAPYHNLVKISPLTHTILFITPSLAECHPLSTLHEAVTPPSVDLPTSWAEAVSNVLRDLIGRREGANDGWGLEIFFIIDDHNCIQLYHKDNGKMVNFNDILIKNGFLIPLVRSAESSEADFNDLSSPPKKPHNIPTTRVFNESTDTPISLESSLSSEFHFQDSSSDYDMNLSPVSSPQRQQQLLIQKFSPDQPKVYNGVYIEGSSDGEIWNDLEITKFPSSVRSALEKRNFIHPTAIQAYSWPLIYQQRDTMLLSPQESGKTLAYLLPLLSFDEMKRSLNSEPLESYEPLLIILVSTSYNAWSINEQSIGILSSINAALRFRSCAAYFTEGNSIVRVLNGTDVLVATPPALMRLMKTKIVTLTNLYHLVLDDVQSLFNHFASEIDDIMVTYRTVVGKRLSEGRKNLGQHVVACASSYDYESWKWAWQYLNNPVAVINSPMDLIVLKRLKCHVVVSSFPAHVVRKLASSEERADDCPPLVVCVANEFEAFHLIQVLSTISIIAFNWTTGKLPLNEGDVAVVIDESLSLLDVSNDIKHLVHCLLPNTKSTFNRRNTLLYPSILAHNRPIISIIMDDSCVGQSDAIVRLLKRLGQPVPEGLLKLAEEKQKSFKRNPKLYSLCPYVKAYGECLSIHNCKMAHTAAELRENKATRLAKPRLPKDGVVKVKVKHVSSPVQLWVSIVEHTPFHRGDPSFTSSDTMTFGELSLCLSVYYGSSANRELLQTPKRGDICGLKEATGECYRAQILDFSAPLGLYFHHKEQAKVRLIDTGDTLIVDVNQLLTLPDEYLTTPPLVAECYVCGLRPNDCDINWPPDCVSMALKLFKDKVLIGRVALSHDNTMWLDPIEDRVNLCCLSINTALYRPQSAIIKKGLAVSNRGHLDKVRIALNKSEYYDLRTKYKDCRRMSIADVDDHMKVTIQAVHSAPVISVQKSSARANLQSIADTLNPSTPQIKGFRDFFHCKRYEPGDMCTAEFPHDEKWYRACVQDVRNVRAQDGSTSDSESDIDIVAPTDVEYLCLFVDYGDIEWIESNKVEPIATELLEFPLQSIECTLDVRIKDELDVYEEFVERLWECSREKEFHIKVLPQASGTSLVHLVTDEGDDFVNAYCNELILSEDREVTPTDRKVTPTDREVTPTEELNVSEIKSLLLLIQQGAVPMSEFLSYIFSNRGNVVITEEDVNCLSIVIKHPKINKDFLKGVSLLLMKPSEYAKVFSNHSGFCQSVEYLVKTPTSKDVLLSAVEIVQLLCTERESSFHIHVPELMTMLLNIILSTKTVKLLAQCLEIVTYLIQTGKTVFKPYSVTDKLLIFLPKLLQNDQLLSQCIRFLCVMIHNGDKEYQQSILRMLDTITAGAKLWPTEIREPLLFCICYSSNADIKSYFCRLYERWIVDGVEISSFEQSLYQAIVPTVCCHKNDNNEKTEESCTPTDVGIEHESTEDENDDGKPVYSQELVPKVLWSQTRSVLCLSVKVSDCKKAKVECEDNTVSFKYIQPNTNILYSFKLELFGKIKSGKSACNVSMKGSEVLVKIAKQQDIYWPRVTRTKQKPPYIAVDYERWKEESSSSDEEEDKKSNLWSGLSKPSFRVVHTGDDLSDDSVQYEDVNVVEHDYM